jgi:hypothetical protein
MYRNNPCQFEAALVHLQQYQQSYEGWALGAALQLYERARTQRWLGQIWSMLNGRPRHLFDLKEIEATCTVRARCHVGTRAVPIRQIRGSEGRCQDFDPCFRPLHTHNRGRWLSVAVARLRGVPMPPVELIQVGDLYFARDGHHRISVARALGQDEIDAVVTFWDVTGPLPWAQAVAVRSATELRPLRG